MAGNYPIDILPDPSARGYSFSVEPVCFRQQMDSGRYRQYRKSTKQFHFVNLSWDLTDDELNLWKGWYNAVTNNGGDWFQINLAFGGGLKGNAAQFANQGYQVTMTDLFEWNVSATLQLEGIDEIDTQGELETAGADLGLVGADWLGVLPNLRMNYGFTVESATARTQIVGGRYANRNRFKRNVHIAQVEWFLSDDQMEFFKGWHKVILEFGCKPFAMDLTFGDGFQSNTARMVDGAFSAQYVEGCNCWIVSAQLECDAVVGINTYSEYLTATVG